MKKKKKLKKYKDFLLSNGKNSLDKSIFRCIEACKYVYLFPNFWIHLSSKIKSSNSNLNKIILLAQHKFTFIFWNEFCITMRDVIRLMKKILNNAEKYKKIVEYLMNTKFLKFFLRDLITQHKQKIKIQSVLSFCLHNYSEDDYGIKGCNASWDVMENEMRNLFFTTKYYDTKKEFINLINLLRSIDYGNNYLQISENIDFNCPIFDFLTLSIIQKK